MKTKALTFLLNLASWLTSYINHQSKKGTIKPCKHGSVTDVVHRLFFPRNLGIPFYFFRRPDPLAPLHYESFLLGTL